MAVRVPVVKILARAGSGGDRPAPPMARPVSDVSAFSSRPHRSLVRLALPVMAATVTEPITGLVDTAFVKELGVSSAAALGVGTVVLSSLLWLLNFVSIGAQTEVAHAHGAGRPDRERSVWGAALAISVLAGALLGAIVIATAGPVAAWMGAEAEAFAGAVEYLRIRALGAPAVLVTVAGFGVLRGRAEMRAAMCIAVTVNGLNVALDAVLIFGLGPVPALGIAGAAWASVASQVVGSGLTIAAVCARLGRPGRPSRAQLLAMLAAGRDLGVRTALLLVFVVWMTRAATRAGPEAGAAHQAIRQFWMFAALALDAFAIAAQSQVGVLVGAGRVDSARRAAGVAVGWGLGVSLVLGAGMLWTRAAVARLLVPEAAWPAFDGAWTVLALAQPLHALSFVTDGVHWAMRDYRYLRNVMLLATPIAAAAVEWLAPRGTGGEGLLAVWAVQTGWIAVRAAFGVLRIWPGLGAAPLCVAGGGGSGRPRREPGPARP